MTIAKRYNKIDGWRGYWVPGRAVVGSSDTGTWDDSPCPSHLVKAELQRFRREVLRPAGIKSTSSSGNSSNVFCGKRWLLVSEQDFPRAAQLATDWLEEHRRDTSYIHDANQDQLGYKPRGV